MRRDVLRDGGIDLRPESVRRLHRVRTRLRRWSATAVLTAVAIGFVAVDTRAELAAGRGGVPDESALRDARDSARRGVETLADDLGEYADAIDLVDRAAAGPARRYLADVAAAAATTPTVTIERLHVEDTAAEGVWRTEALKDAAAPAVTGPADEVALVASTDDAGDATRFAEALRHRLPSGTIEIDSSGPLELDGPMRHRFRLVWRRAAEETP